jgi:hypothetical protein
MSEAAFFFGHGLTPSGESFLLGAQLLVSRVTEEIIGISVETT